MAIVHAQPGEVISVRPLGSDIATTQTRTLFRGVQIEAIRLVVLAGKEIPEHRTKGELLVQCLDGRVSFAAAGKTRELQVGDLLYLPEGAPHSLKAIEDSSLLLTVVLPKH